MFNIRKLVFAWKTTRLSSRFSTIPFLICAALTMIGRSGFLSHCRGSMNPVSTYYILCEFCWGPTPLLTHTIFNQWQERLGRNVALGRRRIGIALGSGKGHRCVIAWETSSRTLLETKSPLPALHCRCPEAGRLLPQHVARPEATRYQRHHTGRPRPGGRVEKRVGHFGIQRDAVHRSCVDPTEIIAGTNRSAADAFHRRKPRRPQFFPLGKRNGTQRTRPADTAQTGAQSPSPTERRCSVDDMGRGCCSHSNSRESPPGPSTVQSNETNPPAEITGWSWSAQAQTCHESYHGGAQNTKLLAQFPGAQTRPPTTSSRNGLSRNGKPPIHYMNPSKPFVLYNKIMTCNQ